METAPATRIYGFVGDYGFLRPGYPAPIVVQDVVYPSLLHAFLAGRTTDQGVREKIAQITDASEASTYALTVPERPDWSTLTGRTMAYLQRLKFRTHKSLGGLLLDTGTAEIVDANKRGDEFWGVDYATGEGENRLGRILMGIRGELLRDYAVETLPEPKQQQAVESPAQQLLGVA